jgi:hypothetical protein
LNRRLTDRTETGLIRHPGGKWGDIKCLVVTPEGFTIHYQNGNEAFAVVDWNEVSIARENDYVEVPSPTPFAPPLGKVLSRAEFQIKLRGELKEPKQAKRLEGP